MRDRIIQAMRDKGIKSMAELERKAGVPSGTLRNMGQGHMPSMEKVNKIAACLGIPVDWIVNGSENDNTEKVATVKIKTGPKQCSDSVQEFAALIASLNNQNMEALLDYLRYLVEKQGRG